MVFGKYQFFILSTSLGGLVRLSYEIASYFSASTLLYFRLLFEVFADLIHECRYLLSIHINVNVFSR